MKKILILTKNTRKALAKAKILKSRIEQNGIEADLAIWEDLFIQFDSQNRIFDIFLNDKKINKYDLIFIRTAGKFVDQATVLSHYCQQNKIKFFDKKFLQSHSNSKLLQSLYFYSNNLLFPKTINFSNKNTSVDNIIKFVGLPLIAKKAVSSRGDSVFLIKTKQKLAEFINKNNLTKYLFQEFIPNDFDWRILVIGGKAEISEKRVRKVGNDIRNNVKLGAKEIFCPAPKSINILASKAAKASNITLAGVDIIRNNNKNYLVEINRSPSLTLDEKISNEIPSLIRYIKKYLES